MGLIAAVGFLGLLSSVLTEPAPQVCSLISNLQPRLPCPNPNSNLYIPTIQPSPNCDGPIKVIIQNDNVPDALISAGFRAYPGPGGNFYIHPNPDITIQPRPIVIRPPQFKPIQPASIEVQPPPLGPITPPPITIRPPQLKPINVPPICVRPNPLPPITPPCMMIKPPCPPLIQPPAITIRQPELALITPPQIVVRPPSPANLQPPTISFMTSALSNNRVDPPCPQPIYPPSPCSCSN